MAFDDDLLAELDELGGDFSDNESTHSDVNDPSAATAAAASKTTNLHDIAPISFSQELLTLLTNLQASMEIPASDKKVEGRIEDNPDYQLMVAANKYTTEIGNEMIEMHRHILDRYKPRFPELETLVRNPIDYARTVKAIGASTDITKVDLESLLPNAIRMVVTVTGSTTTGSPLDHDDLQHVIDACDSLLEMQETLGQIIAFIESRMPLIAPNLTAIVGSATAAKLIAEAGGLTALSKIPACNIQVLGKSQSAGLGLSAITAQKHVGIVFYSDVVRSVPEDFRNKMMRKVSAKCALAARIDAQHESADGSLGLKFRTDLDTQVAKLLEAAPSNNIKPLPKPDDAPKKRRAGRKVRKMKEPFQMSELRKQRDRLQFGTAQEEVVVMDEMEGLGMMNKMAGQVRATQMNNKAKAKVAKKYDRYMKAPAGAATSGIASLAFTQAQGFELANPQAAAEHRQKRQRLGSDKYFASSTPFMGRKESK
ncbi:U4/U6-U5 snRNP complex subunit prp31 [Linderina macrospora]|uniref:U4/U6-U5 snRNP complex subunit prp31 n=1 Tax=Linderina macrospora TaxID=4868 RepID=A0ACC1JC75_9FUNG|nr:U4/U6-U5 snRNP complex subunit prp31 [Linderina macrospora]